MDFSLSSDGFDGRHQSAIVNASYKSIRQKFPLAYKLQFAPGAIPGAGITWQSPPEILRQAQDRLRPQRF